MTKKDYELIARVFSGRTRDMQRYINIAKNQNNAQAVDMLQNEYNHYKYLAYDMATELAQTNKLFDRKRFLTACGIN